MIDYGRGSNIKATRSGGGSYPRTAACAALPISGAVRFAACAAPSVIGAVRFAAALCCCRCCCRCCFDAAFAAVVAAAALCAAAAAATVVFAATACCCAVVASVLSERFQASTSICKALCLRSETIYHERHENHVPLSQPIVADRLELCFCVSAISRGFRSYGILQR